MEDMIIKELDYTNKVADLEKEINRLRQRVRSLENQLEQEQEW
jgi:polyhydroxyalkanoate synthesis regulator phasin